MKIKGWIKIYSKSTLELERSLITGEIENDDGDIVKITVRQRNAIAKELTKRNKSIGNVYYYNSGQKNDITRPWVVEENNPRKFKIRKLYGSNVDKNTGKKVRDKKAFYWLYHNIEKRKSYFSESTDHIDEIYIEIDKKELKNKVGIKVDNHYKLSDSEKSSFKNKNKK